MEELEIVEKQLQEEEPEEESPEEETPEEEPSEPEAEPDSEPESVEEVLNDLETLAKEGKVKSLIAKAKEIRKKGEPWRAALKRATKMLSKEIPLEKEKAKEDKSELKEILNSVSDEELKKELLRRKKKNLPAELAKKVDSLSKDYDCMKKQIEELKNKGIKETRHAEKLETSGSKRTYESSPDGSISSWE